MDRPLIGRADMRTWARLALVLAVAWRDAPGQGAVVVLPEDHSFRPLRADPKEPAFFAAYLSMTSEQRSTGVGSVGLGENIGLLGGRAGRWDVSLSAGVFSQFDMATPSYDLLNTDFVIGMPFAWRAGRFALRARIYHQSSHLGDEYLLRTGVSRVNYSYESMDLLAACEFGPARLYAGGEDLVRRDPATLRPGVLHWGAEWMPRRAHEFGALGAGAPYFAVDAKSSQQRSWEIGWDLRVGYEFAAAAPGHRRWSVELRAYHGPSPYGQFYETDVDALGVAVGFTL